MWWSRLLLENLRWWSTRTRLQKETSLYSEQAMYYRYYKEAVAAPTVRDAWRLFTRDTGVQFPDTINALQRYNVYPELAAALLYRSGLTGYREPIDFYADAVHALQGLFVAALFAAGAFAADSPAGGAVTIAVFACAR